MPKTSRSPQLVTRLAKADLQQFRQLAQVKGTTYSSLLREAVLWYLKATDQQRLNELEGLYASQLRSGIQQVLSEMRKGHIDLHSVYQFLGQLEPPLMQECTTKAHRRIPMLVELPGTAMAAQESSIPAPIAS